jgi:enoyl-CoA hydratase/carnithine racemase
MSKVLYEKRDRIAWVTINRPEARNAIDPDVHRLMIDTWADFASDDSVDVAVLTGAGEAFSAGADLKTYIPPIIEDATPARVREIVELGLNGLTRGMHRIEKPIVAASTAGRSPGASRRRWRATSGSLPTARCSAPSRRAAATTTATAASCGW